MSDLRTSVSPAIHEVLDRYEELLKLSVELKIAGSDADIVIRRVRAAYKPEVDYLPRRRREAVEAAAHLLFLVNKLSTPVQS